MYNCLRIIFAGTPDFATRHLEALISTQYQVVGVFTQPDRPTGRGKRLNVSSVKQLAEKHSIPLFQPYSLQQPEVQNWVAELKPDIMVVVAYGLILPQSVLELPRLGCINVHGSLLPRWRGSAPIQRALCAGDELTGVTIIQMDAGIDTGAILHKVTCTIQPNDTSASLYEKISQIGPDALLFTLEQLTAGNATAEPQDNSLATYAEKLSKKEARINWHLPAVQLALYIRAFNPWPTSYFQLFGRPMKVWDANVSAQQNIAYSPGTILAANKAGIDIATGDGVLTLTKLQLAGKQTMPVHLLLNAHREWFIPGSLLE